MVPRPNLVATHTTLECDGPYPVVLIHSKFIQIQCTLTHTVFCIFQNFPFFFLIESNKQNKQTNIFKSNKNYTDSKTNKQTNKKCKKWMESIEGAFFLLIRTFGA